MRDMATLLCLKVEAFADGSVLLSLPGGGLMKIDARPKYVISSPPPQGQEDCGFKPA